MDVTSKSKAKNLPSVNRASGQTVPIQLRTRAAPLWLIRLCRLQRGFCVVTFLLVAAMVTVYGWSVYSQQTWSQAYRKLETLKRQERQLATTNEVLKNHMAVQAEQPATGLLPSNPALTIFLTKPERPARAAEPVPPGTKAAAQNKEPKLIPMGY